MKVSIDKRNDDDILYQGSIIEFEFDDKHIIGIYIGREKSGYTVTILNHPTFTPGTVTTYSLINNVRLFKGTITISNG